jgi:hypothetical protein
MAYCKGRRRSLMRDGIQFSSEALISIMRLANCLVLLCVALGSGCGSPAAQSNGTADTRMRLLGRLYGQFMAENNGQPPMDESQLIGFLGKSAEFLKTQGVANLQELLVSARDGQPLVVLYGKQIVEDENSGFPWIAYESQGRDGKKYMIGARGNVDQMTSEQIEAMVTR